MFEISSKATAILRSKIHSFHAQSIFHICKKGAPGVSKLSKSMLQKRVFLWYVNVRYEYTDRKNIHLKFAWLDILLK